MRWLRACNWRYCWLSACVAICIWLFSVVGSPGKVAAQATGFWGCILEQGSAPTCSQIISTTTFSVGSNAFSGITDGVLADPTSNTFRYFVLVSPADVNEVTLECTVSVDTSYASPGSVSASVSVSENASAGTCAGCMSRTTVGFSTGNPVLSMGGAFRWRSTFPSDYDDRSNFIYLRSLTTANSSPSVPASSVADATCEILSWKVSSVLQTPVPTVTNTPGPTSTPTNTPTAANTPTSTATATGTNTPTSTPTSALTATPTRRLAPSITPAPGITPLPTVIPGAAEFAFDITGPLTETCYILIPGVSANVAAWLGVFNIDISAWADMGVCVHPYELEIAMMGFDFGAYFHLVAFFGLLAACWKMIGG